MEPKADEPEAVGAARAAVFDPDPQPRSQAISTLVTLLSADVVDIRTTAPHLGLSLFDEEPRIREEAARAVYYLCDLQGPVWIVRALSSLIELALEQAEGEAAANLRSALGSISKRGR